MAIRRVLLDEGLLLELLFGRPLPMGQGDRLWDLFVQGQVQGYVTDVALSQVGPGDAALRALNLAVNRFIPVADVQMVHYRCLATTADSPVSAVVLLKRQMALFPGRGLHTDGIMASIDAYLDALGYLIFCDRL